MAKNPSKEKVVLKKGAWSLEEDEKLISYISRFGIWNWSEIPKQAGLARTSKSCRLRWVNYLKPGIKRGNISKEEEETIVKLHNILGNRWAAIAAKLPQRTDNEIKNFWKTRMKKHKDLSSSKTESSAESDNKNVGEAKQQENGISQKMGETQDSNTDDFSPLSSSQAVRIESLLDIEDYIGLSETSTSNEAQRVLLDEVSYPTEIYSPLELYDSYYDPNYDFWSSPFI